MKKRTIVGVGAFILAVLFYLTRSSWMGAVTPSVEDMVMESGAIATGAIATGLIDHNTKDTIDTTSIDPNETELIEASPQFSVNQAFIDNFYWTKNENIIPFCKEYSCNYPNYYNLYTKSGELILDDLVVGCEGTCEGSAIYDPLTNFIIMSNGGADAGFSSSEYRYFDLTTKKNYGVFAEQNGSFISWSKGDKRIVIKPHYTENNIYLGDQYFILHSNDRNPSSSDEGISLYDTYLPKAWAWYGDELSVFKYKIDIKTRLLTLIDDLGITTINLDNLTVTKEKFPKDDPSNCMVATDKNNLWHYNILIDTKDNDGGQYPANGGTLFADQTHRLHGRHFNYSKVVVVFNNDTKEYPIKNRYEGGLFDFGLSIKNGTMQLGENNIRIRGYDGNGKLMCEKIIKFNVINK